MFENKSISAADALLEAQKIAFGPVIFQAARILRDFGILAMLYDAKEEGMSVQKISQKAGISEYGVKVLCESGLSMGALSLKDERYMLTKIGYFLQFDEMTNINMNFNHDVNYLGLFNLDDAIKTASPSGLNQSFKNEWETIYPHLSALPEKAKKSWFDFDHFYSDAAFGRLVEIIAERAPEKLLDVGGNTGKWAVAITQKSLETSVTILDHQKQIDVALENAKKAGVEDRVDGVPMDLLDHTVAFPTGYDAVWMSQFLDCFAPEDITALLRRAADALNTQGSVYIIEPYWDRQSHEIGAFCLINTSPYFTALANGTSKMYRAIDMHQYIKEAGLVIVEEIDHLGFGHTLTVCKKS
ncbi:MAG: class I SAM-dependent methyltransferase [Campylobacterota bacterium]|nr:class I SAM-dependent methyltransferase [Campylobacterota bacterium]